VRVSPLLGRLTLAVAVKTRPQAWRGDIGYKRRSQTKKPASLS